MQQPPPPPGWYPDPQAAGAERWWDGIQWTPAQRPAGGIAVPAPPVAMSRADEKTWAIMAHLSALAASVVGLAVLGPLVVYLVKREESPFVRAHAAAALNFQISWLIWGIGVGIVTFLLIFFLVGLLLIPVLIVGAIAWLVLTIMAAVKAGNGEPPMTYPLTITFVS